jgi:hypothetical protein
MTTRGQGRTRWGVLVVVLGLLLTTACSGSPAPTVAPSAPSSATPAPVSASPSATGLVAPASAAAASSIVGEWVGTHDCQRIMTMLDDAGLPEFVAEQVYGNELVPGVTEASQLKDPAHPCAGAVPRKHSHYFTADGEFGSKDFNGQQVDDGEYKLEGAGGIVINDMKFKYEIHGDELSLEPEPVDISTCTTEECRFGATWVLMVAMPGTVWKRGTISG